MSWKYFKTSCKRVFVLFYWYMTCPNTNGMHFPSSNHRPTSLLSRKESKTKFHQWRQCFMIFITTLMGSIVMSIAPAAMLKCLFRGFLSFRHFTCYNGASDSFPRSYKETMIRMESSESVSEIGRVGATKWAAEGRGGGQRTRTRHRSSDMKNRKERNHCEKREMTRKAVAQIQSAIILFILHSSMSSSFKHNPQIKCDP